MDVYSHLLSERHIASQTHLTVFMEYSLIQACASFVYFNWAFALYFWGTGLDGWCCKYYFVARFSLTGVLRKLVAIDPVTKASPK